MSNWGIRGIKINAQQLQRIERDTRAGNRRIDLCDAITQATALPSADVRCYLNSLTERELRLFSRRHDISNKGSRERLCKQIQVVASRYRAQLAPGPLSATMPLVDELRERRLLLEQLKER
jgi:hypothetical protein